MKLRVEIDGNGTLLDLATLPGSVEEVMPGVFSVLIDDRSFRLHVAPALGGFEVWVGLQRFLVSIADPRDQALDAQKAGAAGPVEIRAQMPGKIIKLLAEAGALVSAGQGLIVIEAMKMQNEVKAPKNGIVKRIYVAEGTTVGAGEPLVLVD